MRKLTFLFLLSWVTSIGTSLADFGDQPIDWSNTESSDFQDYVTRSLNAQGGIVDNYWMHYWLQQKLVELNLASPTTIGNTLPLIIRDDAINAFAMPGNVIGMNAGLWVQADNESEFISVLAHEMSHIALDHFSRLSDNSSRQGWVVATGILLTILLAQENPDAANAALLGSLATAQQNQLSFSQAMEVEADQLSQSILRSTPYDPEAGRTFFQKLEANSSASTAYEFLRTHPLGNTRSAKLSGSTTRQTPQNSPVFQLFKQLLAVGESREKKETIWAESSFDQTSLDPNIQFALAQKLFFQESDSQSYIDRLLNLSNQYPAFLPAKFELLSTYLKNDSAQLCPYLAKMNGSLEDKFLTLSVLESLKSSAQHCGHSSAETWHIKWLWVSGNEVKAISFLTQKLNSETETNQAARLKVLLDEYSRRYDRFR